MNDILEFFYMMTYMTIINIHYFVGQIRIVDQEGLRHQGRFSFLCKTVSRILAGHSNFLLSTSLPNDRELSASET